MKLSLPTSSLVMLALAPVVKGGTTTVVPLDLVFAVDESGSMSSAQEGVKTQVASMFAQLTAQFSTFRMGMVGFGQASNNGDPVLRQVLTRDQAAFQLAVDNLEVSGGNEPGFLAVQEIAANSVGGQPLNGSQYPGAFPGPAGYCIVLITDEDSNNGGDLTSATTALTSTGGHVFAITDNSLPGYVSLVAATNGTSYDLYDFISNSTPVLESIINTCVATVTLAKCGDGILDPIEECDDGNLIDGDGCSSTCKITCSQTTYWLWDPNTDKLIRELKNNTGYCIPEPYNIEVRPCTLPKTMPVNMRLKTSLVQIQGQNEFYPPFYLWGDTTATGDVYKNKKPLPKGTYYINTKIDGKTEKFVFKQKC